MTELQLLEKRRELLLAELTAIDLRADSIRREQKTESADFEKPPRMLTVREAANETGLSYDHIRKLCVTGRVKHVMVGSKRLVNAESLRAYLREGC